MDFNQAECPPLTLLTEFSEGQVGDGAFQAIASHLEECRNCETHLEHSTRVDPLVNSLRCAARVQWPVEKEEVLSKAMQRALDVVVPSVAVQPVKRLDNAETNVDLGLTSSGSSGDSRDFEVAIEPSSMLGPYQLIEELGRGGMGVVFRGIHTMMNRPAAIKILPFHRTSDTAAQRFEKEIQAVGQLTHPNIVTGYDAGVFEGRYYLAMELLEGVDLSSMAKSLKNDFQIADVCEMVRQAGLGLSHAHKAGIIHRDIKPANMMLCEANPMHRSELESKQDAPTDVVVKILDMGLARMELPTGQNLDMTHTGQLVGTIHYMPPEQCLDVREADVRSDVYSLGASLFRLLTGRPPWAGQLETRGQVLNAIMSEQHPSVARFRSDLPKPLVNIVDRALKKDPDKRFQSMQDMVDALTPSAVGSELPKLLLRTRDQASGKIQPLGALAPSKRSSSEPLSDAQRAASRQVAFKSIKAHPLKWIAIACLPVLAILFSIIWLKTDGGYIRIEHDPGIDVSVQVLKNGKAIETVEVGKEGERAWYRSGQYEVRIVSDEKDELVISGDEFVLSRGDSSHVVSISLKTETEKVEEVKERSEGITKETSDEKSLATANSGNASESAPTPKEFSRFQFKPLPAFDSIPLDMEMVDWRPNEAQTAFLKSLQGLSNHDRLESVLAKIQELHKYPFAAPNPDVEMRGDVPVGIGLHSWTVSEIWPLVGLPTLEKMDIADSNVVDYSPLQALFIKTLKTNTILFNREAEAVFENCATLKKINGKTKERYLADRKQKRDEYESFANEIPTFPKQEVLDWVATELQLLNPGFEGKGSLNDRDAGFLYKEEERRCFIWRGIDIRDMSPMRLLPMEELEFSAHGDAAPELDKLALTDLSWLKGSSLKRLTLSRVGTRDLRPIRALDLESLHLRLALVETLRPLDQMKLKSFSANEVPIADLSPLANMPLESLKLAKQQAWSLAPLTTNRLKSVELPTMFTDMEPLYDSPLESLTANLRLYLEPQTKWLAEHPTLKTINGKPAGTFRREARIERNTHQRFLNSLEGLPVDERIKAIKSHLEGVSRNKLTFETIQNDDRNVTEVKLLTHGPYQRRDAWSLLAFPKLRKLTLGSTNYQDWSAITHLPIEELVLPNSEGVLMGTEDAPWTQVTLINEDVFRQISALKVINGRPAREVLEEMKRARDSVRQP